MGQESMEHLKAGEEYAQTVFMVRALENRVQRDPHIPTPEVEQHVNVICDRARNLADEHQEMQALCEGLQSIKLLRPPELLDRLRDLAAQVGHTAQESPH